MNRMHIILTGHLHKPKPSFLHIGAGKALILSAGASFETRVHWNEKRLPEQRVDLYQSIITWLLRSREQKPGRLNLETSERHLGTLALSMQMTEGKMKLETGRHRAAELIAGGFKGKTGEEKINNAEKFLEQEEIDSGIVVCRGNNIAFWHRSFQEYMAARALGGKGEADQKHILIHPDVLYNPGWCEILLLFGGVLYHQGMDKIDGFLNCIIDICDKKEKILTAQAQCAGLIGSIIRDLDPYHYTFEDKRYTRILESIMGIFDKKIAPSIPLTVRVEAADAFAQAGDMRFAKPRKNWISIPGCIFFMGSQKDDHQKPNFDLDAYSNEFPVHKVLLSPFKIAKYPVTVGIFPTDCTTEGVIDMGGNVWEWCKDWYDDTAFYKKSHESTNPVNDESGNLGIILLPMLTLNLSQNIYE